MWIKAATFISCSLLVACDSKLDENSLHQVDKDIDFLVSNINSGSLLDKGDKVEIQKKFGSMEDCSGRSQVGSADFISHNTTCEVNNGEKVTIIHRFVNLPDKGFVVERISVSGDLGKNHWSKRLQ